ncbi:predicted protein [Thalassiosira pseudonana CCMP1335]|uniref:Ubiquitin-like domain-containing protein n=1 Tax=Thalassiosira pseudonana TaxID=35128 RepID=B8C452_THAPS|nr:predicted protein [Thalassiosira pseudonana CCMP1335]EED91660.1 predicted protein [Thalassiosira pseudonana CCMP1335]
MFAHGLCQIQISRRPSTANKPIQLSKRFPQQRLQHPAMSEGKDYIRVKRRNQTFFIHTTPTDTFHHIKSEISKAMNGQVVPAKMRLYVPTATTTTADKESTGKSEESSPIPDGATLADHEVKNDGVLYLTFVKDWEESGGEDGSVPVDESGWENVDIEKIS